MQSLGHAYKALADLLNRPALSEESRRAVLTTLVVLERELETWSAGIGGDELDAPAGSSISDFDDEPTSTV
jgi:hypothetical protein